MKFLIVCPKYAPKGEPYTFPLGLAYVSSYLKSKGFNVHCLNLCSSDDPVAQQLERTIKRHDINVVCTGAMSIHWRLVDEVLRATKRIDPTITTVVGGAIVTATPEVALKKLRMDIGVLYEGEETMADLAAVLCKGESIRGVPSIAYCDSNDNVVVTETRPSPDLDTLPLPDYDGFDYEDYLSRLVAANSCYYYSSISNSPQIADIVSSRSCPFRCTFCYHPLGHTYRQRSVASILEEVEFLVGKYGVNIVLFCDELFAVTKKRAYELAEGLRKRNVHWFVQLRVSDVDHELLRTIKDAGAFFVGYGIENPNDEILASMQKRISRAEIESALKETREAKLGLQGNILFGDPAETKQTVRESLTWWNAHPEYDLMLGMIMTLPASPIYNDALSAGLIKDEYQFIKDEFPIINLTKLGHREFGRLRVRIGYLARKLKGRNEGKVTSSRSEKQGDRTFHFVKIRCPACRTISEYKLVFVPDLVTLFCRACLIRFCIKSTDAFVDCYGAVDLFKERLHRRLYDSAWGYAYAWVLYYRYRFRRKEDVLLLVKRIVRFLRFHFSMWFRNF